MFKFKEDTEYTIAYEWKYGTGSTKIIYLGNGLYKEGGSLRVAETNHVNDLFAKEGWTNVHVLMPYTATEIFKMYTHLNNFTRGIHCDWEYAKRKASEFIKDLKHRKYVMYTSGKLEQYDYLCLEWIKHGIPKEIPAEEYRTGYTYKVGEKVQNQNGDHLTIVARSMMTTGYESVVLSNGVHCYDRYQNEHSLDNGRATGTCGAYLSPMNIRKECYVDRYKKAREFASKHGLDYDHLIKNLFVSMSFRDGKTIYKHLDTEFMKYVGITDPHKSETI